jgi:hypothetical protein
MFVPKGIVDNRSAAVSGGKIFELQKNDLKPLESLSRAQNRTPADIVNCHEILGPALPRTSFPRSPQPI